MEVVVKTQDARKRASRCDAVASQRVHVKRRHAYVTPIQCSRRFEAWERETRGSIGDRVEHNMGNRRTTLYTAYRSSNGKHRTPREEREKCTK
ncbi:hypothetical protein VTO73DRAFT_8417 [Trametes versicolor]